MHQFETTILGRLLEPALSLRLTLTLLHFLWQGALLGLAAFAADRGLRRATSRTRYAIFVGILATMGAALPTTFLLIRTAEPQTKLASALEATPAPIVMTNSSPAPMPRPIGEASRPADPIPGSESEPITDLSRADAVIEPPPTANELPTTRLRPYAAPIAIGYLVGIVLMLARLAVALQGGRRLRLAATPIPDGPIAELVRRQAKQIGLKTAPLVAWCTRNSVPVVVGILRPMILLPSALATGFDPSQLEALLTHELAHIRRFDPLVNLLQRLIEVLLFFHPAVWYVSRRVSAERENACDDLVLSAGWPALRYAQALLQMAEFCAAARGISPQSSATLAASGGGVSQFKRRVLRLLEIEDAPRVRLTRGGVILAAAAIVLMAVTPKVIRAVAQSASESATTRSGKSPAGETAASDAERRDIYGDALPAGAILRLGTIRLRHPEGIRSVAFSPDGRMLATTGGMIDPQIRLWDLRTGRLIRALVGSVRGGPESAVFTPDGSRLAAISFQRGVEFWDVGSGRKVSDKRRPHESKAFAFAPDGRSYATVASGGTVSVWNTENGSELLVLQPEKSREGPFSLAFSPEGKLLACGAEGDIHFYDVGKGVETGSIKNAHGWTVRNLQFGADGKTLFSAGENTYTIRPGYGGVNAQLRMWDVAKKRLLRDFIPDKAVLGYCTLVLSKDGRKLVCMEQNDLVIWDVMTGKPSRKIASYWPPTGLTEKPFATEYFMQIQRQGVALSPDATTIACITMPLHHVLLWDVGSGRQKLAFPDSHAAACDGLACSPDGSRIATCSQDGTVRLWDPSTSKQLRAFAAADSFPCMSRSVAFTRDGRMLATSGHIQREEGDVGFVRIWDAQSGALRRDVEAGQGAAKLAFSNDGSRLAVETTNFIEFQLRMTPDEPKTRPERSIVIVDTRTGAKRVRIKYESAASAVKCLAFSPDDSTLTAADALGALNVWDATTGQLVRRIAVLPATPDAGTPKRRRRRSELSGAAISADCSLAIINGEFTDAITLWDINKGTQVGEVKTDSEGSIGSLVALSPDKRVIASAAWGAEDLTPEKHTLRIWDATSGRLIKRYQRPYCNRIVSLEFATDGRRLISGMSDGTALIWDVPAL